MNLQIAPSKPSDLPAVLSLLAEVKLPPEGVAEHFADFLIARTNERVVGCVGLEKYGPYALLRSLAVAPDFRGQGLGLQLTRQAVTYAQANTTQTIVLLTTSAADFFARHFGFVITERRQFDAVLSASPEWYLNCCATAPCLMLKLSTETA